MKKYLYDIFIPEKDLTRLYTVLADIRPSESKIWKIDANLGQRVLITLLIFAEEATFLKLSFDTLNIVKVSDPAIRVTPKFNNKKMQPNFET